MSEQELAPAFPAELPGSLTDPAVIADHDWRALCEVDIMTSHWDRPGWRPGRRSYHWFITLGDQPALLGRAQQCQEALAPLRFDLVPPSSLHLTLRRVGFTDEVTPAQASAIATAASRETEGFGTFDLTVGPLAGSRGAIRFTVSPWVPLLKLDQLLSGAAVAAADGGTSRLRPHVTIAYANQAIPASAVRELIEPLRKLVPVQVVVDQAHLVVLRVEDQTYRWETHKTLILT